MLSLPSESKNILRLADWLELQALVAADSNASTGDLERALRRTGAYEPKAEDVDDPVALDDSDDNPIELAILDVFSELERRAAFAGTAYPFVVSTRLLSVRGKIEEYVPYVFCLCLSYFGDTTQRESAAKAEDDTGLELAQDLPTYPRRLFEHLSAIAAANYMGGKSVRFGWPRRGLPSDFGDAIDSLLQDYLREGEGFVGGNHYGSKDRHVDIVAWKDFPDKRSSKIVLLGQCATNREESDWEAKEFELQPISFWNNWVQRPPISALDRAFFIPHCVPEERWSIHARQAGLLFDRCRIAQHAAGDLTGSLTHQAHDLTVCLDWVKGILDTARLN